MIRYETKRTEPQIYFKYKESESNKKPYKQSL